jgi:hypothetical protein
MGNKSYLNELLKKNEAKKIDPKDERLLALKKLIKNWAGKKLSSIELTGSFLKGTMLKDERGIDLLISFKSEYLDKLKELFLSLSESFSDKSFEAKMVDITIQLNFKGLKVALIPCIKKNGSINYHKLYHVDFGVLKKTNLSLHVNEVRESKFIDEIKLIKLWRNFHQLSLPTILIEQIVLKVLTKNKSNNIHDNFISVLEYLKNKFKDDEIIDPANSNQKLSNLLLSDEQIDFIVLKAEKSLTEENLEKVVA